MDRVVESLKDRVSSYRALEKLLLNSSSSTRNEGFYQSSTQSPQSLPPYQKQQQQLQVGVVKAKREEKVRGMQEAEMMRAFFGFNAATLTDRMCFEDASKEVMELLETEFVAAHVPSEGVGAYSDIVSLYLAFHKFIAEASKVKEIQLITTHTNYMNHHFLCFLYKGLITFSKKLFFNTISKTTLLLKQMQSNDQQSLAGSSIIQSAFYFHSLPGVPPSSTKDFFVDEDISQAMDSFLNDSSIPTEKGVSPNNNLFQAFTLDFQPTQDEEYQPIPLGAPNNNASPNTSGLANRYVMEGNNKLNFSSRNKQAISLQGGGGSAAAGTTKSPYHSGFKEQFLRYAAVVSTISESPKKTIPIAQTTQNSDVASLTKNHFLALAFRRLTSSRSQLREVMGGEDLEFIFLRKSDALQPHTLKTFLFRNAVIAKTIEVYVQISSSIRQPVKRMSASIEAEFFKPVTMFKLPPAIATTSIATTSTTTSTTTVVSSQQPYRRLPSNIIIESMVAQKILSENTQNVANTNKSAAAVIQQSPRKTPFKVLQPPSTSQGIVPPSKSPNIKITLPATGQRTQVKKIYENLRGSSQSPQRFHKLSQLSKLKPPATTMLPLPASTAPDNKLSLLHYMLEEERRSVLTSSNNGVGLLSASVDSGHQRSRRLNGFLPMLNTSSKPSPLDFYKNSSSLKGPQQSQQVLSTNEKDIERQQHQLLQQFRVKRKRKLFLNTELSEGQELSSSICGAQVINLGVDSFTEDIQRHYRQPSLSNRKQSNTRRSSDGAFPAGDLSTANRQQSQQIGTSPIVIRELLQIQLNSPKIFALPFPNKSSNSPPIIQSQEQQQHTESIISVNLTTPIKKTARTDEFISQHSQSKKRIYPRFDRSSTKSSYQSYTLPSEQQQQQLQQIILETSMETKQESDIEVSVFISSSQRKRIVSQFLSTEGKKHNINLPIMLPKIQV